MTTKMNLNGTTRKALVTAIAEITGEQPIYRKVPTCNYDIGDITVTKDGSIICPDDSSILASLEEAGFTAKSDDAADQNEATGLTVSLPEKGTRPVMTSARLFPPSMPGWDRMISADTGSSSMKDRSVTPPAFITTTTFG